MEEQKEERNIKKEVEAILFAAGRKVGLEEISSLLQEKDTKKIEEVLTELKKEYDASDSPMFVIQDGDGWKMTVKERYLGVVKDVAPHTELNKALLETLAIIAWKQPVFQADVIKIRGSTAYEHIKDLVEMGFITKVKHGRSYILKPSTRFFDYFDLPGKEAVREVFKDVEFADSEKRKEMGEEPGEEQTTIEGTEMGEESRIKVYEGEGNADKEDAIDEAEDTMETEKLGELEVFDESEGGSEQEQSEEEPEKEEDIPEPEADEDKTKHIIEDIMKDEPEQEKETEDSDDDSGIEEGRDDNMTQEDEEQDGHKRKLSKELEEFAGIGQEKKKKEENKESEEEQESEDNNEEQDTTS